MVIFHSYVNVYHRVTPRCLTWLSIDCPNFRGSVDRVLPVTSQRRFHRSGSPADLYILCIYIYIYTLCIYIYIYRYVCMYCNFCDLRQNGRSWRWLRTTATQGHQRMLQMVQPMLGSKSIPIEPMVPTQIPIDNIDICLVVWNMDFIFRKYWKLWIIQTDSYFSEGLKPPTGYRNQCSYVEKWSHAFWLAWVAHAKYALTIGIKWHAEGSIKTIKTSTLMTAHDTSFGSLESLYRPRVISEYRDPKIHGENLWLMPSQCRVARPCCFPSQAVGKTQRNLEMVEQWSGLKRTHRHWQPIQVRISWLLMSNNDGLWWVEGYYLLISWWLLIICFLSWNIQYLHWRFLCRGLPNDADARR